MTDSTVLAALGRNKYIRLTTFRRGGTAVPTPVWLVADGERLLIITGAGTGKVKRIRHTSRVLLAPSDARGRVPAGAADVEGVAEVIADQRELKRLRSLLRAKYGIAYGLALVAERLLARRSGEGVALQITAPAPGIA